MNEHTDTHDVRRARRLYRRLDDRVVAGVASGLGEYFDVDPVVFRVAFVVLAFIGGVGILAYLAAWFIMPAAPAELSSAYPSARGRPPGERLIQRLQRSPSLLGILLLVVGGALLADQIGVWRPAVVWGVALIALGVLLFRRGGGAGLRPADVQAPPPEPPPPLRPPTPPLEPPALYSSPGHLPPAPRSPRERSSLGVLTLGALFVVLGLFALLQATGAVHLRAVQFPGALLLVVGLGLLAGTWWGRARGLIVVGILLVPAVIVSSIINVPIRGGFGQRDFRPIAAGTVLPAYRLVAGQMDIDLRDAASGASELTVRASVVAGQINVTVPSGVPLIVHGHTGAGELDLFGRTWDGLDVRVDRRFEPAPGSGVLTLDLDASFGQITVVREEGL
jgi:phage shock protein PspC (stress-responsive transcriptional regulator)